MNIRPSLRLFFLLAILIAGIGTIGGMTYVGYRAYFSGIDFSVSEAMRRSAFEVEVSDGRPQDVHGLTIATRWQDLPPGIQRHLDESALQEGVLLKHVIGIPLLTPPEAGYFAMRLERGGQVRYVASALVRPPGPAPDPRELPGFFYIFFTALAAIAAFSLVPFLLLRRIATPIERLTAWARQLGPDELARAAPDFHYRELNGLAQIVRGSLQTVQESVEREKRFLGYASHELRTPIAVIRSNTELLVKMVDKGVAVERQREVLERMARANRTMTDLTETLLWLNRHGDRPLPGERFSLDALVRQLCKDLDHLLAGKSVALSLRCEPTEVHLPEVLCRIVITNLIRNAFQHTQSGSVSISLAGHRLEICNHDEAPDEQRPALGFGLGLELAERLMARQGWACTHEADAAGRRVQVVFPASGPAPA